MFMDNLKSTLANDYNLARTENGAIGQMSSGSALLDLNFAVSSMRGWGESEIETVFGKAFYENKLNALKWLFFARDVRGGLGERRLFRTCLKYLANTQPGLLKALTPLVPFYGRFDDLWCLLDTELKENTLEFVKAQLSSDLVHMNESEPISLLGKWLPSENTSSKETRKLAKEIRTAIGMTPRQYRQMLTSLRRYLKVIEPMMCRGDWSEIDYAVVPSKANLKYKDAFLKHDEERRREFLNKLEKGETKINAGTLFPHDIVAKYNIDASYWWMSNVKSQDDPALEEMWKALPDYVNGASNTICVADGSGSMTDYIPKSSSVTALDVANSLAIYFSERCSGQFKDKYITFSEHPQFVDLSNGNSLREKLQICRHYNEVANTNIVAVFNLILETAIKYHMPQEEMPSNILILSDMEFDSCATCGERNYLCASYDNGTGVKLFDTIRATYEQHGYKLPRLVFWNINSRTNVIPITTNELGVALISGFSPSTCNMVLSEKTDPYECLLDTINAERYDAVENVVKPLLG